MTDQARGEDWPSLASLTTRYLPPREGVPPAVVLPGYSQFREQAKCIAGQTGGRMGERYNPLLIAGDPSRSDFEVQGLRHARDVAAERLRLRRELLVEMDALRPLSAGDRAIDSFALERRKAFALVERPEVAAALELVARADRRAQRDGATKFGQSLLLARRLVEAGSAR